MTDKSGFPEAIAAAKQADVVIMIRRTRLAIWRRKK
jgi:hypothetical protein